MDEQRRQEILNLAPEDRGVLADIMRKHLAEIPGKIQKLRDDATAIEA